MYMRKRTHKTRAILFLFRKEYVKHWESCIFQNLGSTNLMFVKFCSKIFYLHYTIPLIAKKMISLLITFLLYFIVWPFSLLRKKLSLKE